MVEEDLKKMEDERSKVIDMTIGMNGDLSKAIEKMEEWKGRFSKIEKCLPKLSIDKEVNEGEEYKALALINETIGSLKEFSINETIGSLKEFSRKVYQVNSGKKLEERIDITDSRKIYEATITVARNGVYENLLSDNAKAARDAGAGTMKINFERKSNVRYAVSGGALYNFAKKPVIDMIKKEGKDKKVPEGDVKVPEGDVKVPEGDVKDYEYVWQVSDEYKGASAAVTLNIIPEIFFADSFEPFLQLGAAINGNDIGYLLGIGFSVFVFDVGDEVERSLTLSAGIIWQEVEKPNSDMRDGATVEDVTTMGTMKKEYDDGFYVMLGINF